MLKIIILLFSVQFGCVQSAILLNVPRVYKELSAVFEDDELA